MRNLAYRPIMGGASALPITEPARAILHMLDRLDQWDRARAIRDLIRALDAEDIATEDMEDDDPAGGNVEDEGDLDGDPYMGGVQ